MFKNTGSDIGMVQKRDISNDFDIIESWELSPDVGVLFIECHLSFHDSGDHVAKGWFEEQKDEENEEQDAESDQGDPVDDWNLRFVLDALSRLFVHL